MFSQMLPRFSCTKPSKNGCQIVLVLDESGSMATITDDTVKSINQYLKNQSEEDKTWISVYKFNSSVASIVEFQEIQNFPGLNVNTRNYYPSGGTALLDAIGHAIETTNQKISQYEEESRPSVMMVIVTDGEENSSSKYNNQRIKSMVEECTSRNWGFTFLGANIDAFKVGANYGFSVNQTSNYNVNNISDTFAAASAYTSRTRAAVGSGLSASTVTYSSDEISSMVKNHE